MQSIGRCVSCQACGREQKVMKRCTRCRNAFYCSRECQIANWQVHSRICAAPTSQKLLNVGPPVQCRFGDESKTTINIKCNHKKHTIALYGLESTSGKYVMEIISKHLKIPAQSLKIIAKGKLLSEDNVKAMITEKKCRNFQAFGEEAEDEEGLDKGDIEAIMEELHVSRNRAIKSLRSCNGDLIDAILELGNAL